MIPYVVSAAQETELLVFPGMEITCSDVAQCLAIFDPNSTEDRWRDLLAKLSLGLGPAPEQAKGPGGDPSKLTVLDLYEAVEADETLRESVLIFPHFSDGDAYKHINVPRTHLRFSSIKSDGIYVEKPFSSLLPDTIAKVRGSIAEWGRRRRAVIVTGDNRSGTFDRVAAHPCWIKLGENSLEALRQALLADEARFSHEELPPTPAERLVKMRVLSTLTGTEPLTLTFSHGFTAIIGGRGSGKSALLEYMRFGLGRTERDLSDREGSLVRTREQMLVDETLSDDGFVEIMIQREGVSETWRRTLGEREKIVVTASSGHTIEVTVPEAQRRFRSRAFYQKGLSSTMSDPAKAADQITGIAAAEAIDKRRQLDQDIEGARREIQTNFRRLVAYWQAQLQRRQAGQRVADLRQRLEAVSALLAQGGVAQETLDIINSAPVFARGQNYFDAVDISLKRSGIALQDALSNLLTVKLADFEGTDAFSEIRGMHAEVAEAKRSISATLNAAIVRLSELADTRDLHKGLFATALADFEKKYESAVAAQKEHSALIEDSERLGRELRTAEAALVQATEQEEKRKPAITDFAAARESLESLLETRRQVLQQAAEEVEKNSKRLRARVERDRKHVAYVDALSRVFEGSRMQELDVRCLAWIKKVLEENGPSGWRDICDGFLALYEAKIAAESPSDPGVELGKKVEDFIFSGEKITAQQRLRIYANLEDAAVAEIASAVPRDSIQLRHVDDRGQERRFEQASEGQQASALLELLLNQSAGTLIIDQPEDDLDNRVIMDIVQLIRTSKAKRQLVFTTHNPNIVVNGDADKIVALYTTEPNRNPDATTPLIAIDNDGAIETDAIRSTITRIMEGGKDAFDLRSRKYGFSLRDRAP
jgi:ABC-type Mn2+/Zn2+ transport system ATPase subunit